jgi:hypothetical protein
MNDWKIMETDHYGYVAFMGRLMGLKNYYKDHRLAYFQYLWVICLFDIVSFDSWYTWGELFLGGMRFDCCAFHSLKRVSETVTDHWNGLNR